MTAGDALVRPRTPPAATPPDPVIAQAVPALTGSPQPRHVRGRVRHRLALTEGEVAAELSAVFTAFGGHPAVLARTVMWPPQRTVRDTASALLPAAKRPGCRKCVRTAPDGSA